MTRALVFFLAFLSSGPAWAVTRSWNFMPTGNGHGFQIFDRGQNRITFFLEHPYRYVAPGDDGRTSGIGRRNLAHDLYFGVRIGGTSKWLNKCGSADCADYASIEYEAQTHIIHGVTNLGGGVQIDTYYFAPFGYGGNGLMMALRVTNTQASPTDVSVFMKPNLRLGRGRVDPGAEGEDVRWISGGTLDHAEETGPGGGHAIYVPIGGVSHVSCGSDTAMYQALLSGRAIGDQHACTGSDQVPLLEQDLRVPGNGAAWWGAAVLFLDDNPSDPRASLFKDSRSVGDILAAWSMFAGSKTAAMLHDEALAELEAWRKGRAPTQLNDTEKKLWRQSEAILRMGQVLEFNNKNYGMMLASLAPGEWHTGWVRDGTYAIAALAMTGHYEEAQRALEFDLGAEGGFFNGANYLRRNYRISVCRYFGNGFEEGDFNQDGPNIETDGWGLVLWAARLSLHYSCNLAWLDRRTWRGDTVFEALHQVAADIEANITNDLPNGDASIWEVHWNRRQVFAYTAAAQIRGLFDFADIARAHGDREMGDHFAQLAQRMLDKAKSSLVHQPTRSFASHTGVSGQTVHVDGSAVGFFDWRLVPVADPLYTGTLEQFSKLVTGVGGYRRLEPMLSLTGGGAAGTYDLSEWILLDLRIADAWRRAGYELSNPNYVAKSEQLLGKITSAAEANDYLIPELYDPNAGTYAGVVPMVGYGAGAWMMSQLERYGAPAPSYDVGFRQCTDPCFSGPCRDPHKGVCMPSGMTFTCGCDSGFHDEQGSCAEDQHCTATSCAGHGMCSETAGISCACDMGYSGAHCEGCAPGFNLMNGACKMIQGAMPDPGSSGTTGPMGGGKPAAQSFNDGAASLCQIHGPGRPWDAALILSILVASLLVERYRKRRGG